MCRWEGGGCREGEIPRDLAPGGEIPRDLAPGGARSRGGEIPGTPVQIKHHSYILVCLYDFTSLWINKKYTQIAMIFVLSV